MSASRSATAIAFAVLLLASVLASAACGKRGDPLAPLRLVPGPVGDLSARRTAQQVALRFVLPTTNANGAGTIDLDHVEVYAVTIAAGAVTPPNRDLLTKARVVGTIPVKPPPVEDAPDTPASKADKRPSPGDRIDFVEELTEQTLKPTPGLESRPPAAESKPATPTVPAPATPEPPPVGAKPEAAGVKPPTAAGEPKPAAPETVAPPVTVTHPTRIYVLRGVSRGGRPGPPSARVSIPLVSPVAAPTAVVVAMPTEKAVVIDWTPPVAEPGGSPLTFNVYRPESPATPLNEKPLTEIKYEIAGAEFGKEQCFAVRALQTTQNVTIESDVSAPACLTPRDTFPPAAPKNLRALAEDGAVSLVWEPNSEADLGGYLVLRDDGAGGTLQPITPQPVKDATYRDTTVAVGVRYTYVVVAVDTATPRNTSAQSASESVTAR